MNQFKFLLITFLMVFSCVVKSQELPFGFPNTDRSKTILNPDWKFHLGDPDAKYYEKDFDDSNWETVHVPHTLELTSLTLDDVKDEKTQPTFHRKVGWYRRNITLGNSKKKVFLEFEGAHQVTDLWVNGQHVGQHVVGGYTPFHFDISPYIIWGKQNQITLLLDNRRSELVPPDPGPFDYVKFSGLYRDVYLVETNAVHVTFNWESLNSGVHITTPTIDVVNKNATINIKTSVQSERDEVVHCKLSTRIIDKEGIVVRRITSEAQIKPGEEYQFNQIGSLEDDVNFWDIDNPYLYRVNSVVLVDGKEVDFVENKIGLRKFELDPVRGFILNNKPIELIGFNRHQQYPYIGDAVPNRLHYKDMLQFKEFGFNIMRTAHYPQDDALLEACDELGIFAYEEAPTWIGISQNDKWWNNLEKATRAMVRNHRNHPSIVMWGAGVNHRGYVPRIHNTVKQEDPTRLTASQGARWTGWQTSGLTDINANMLYGPFLWDRSEPIFAMEGRRGPEEVAKYKRDPLMTGLISWTAHAYYTFHPNHDKANSKLDRTRSGLMTIFRYPRPRLNWYKSEQLKEPIVFIQEEWKEGLENLTVYSNAEEVELFINNKSIVKQGPSKDTIYNGLDNPPFKFENIKYEKGKVLAKGYFKSGKTLEAVKLTPERPYAIELELDSSGQEFIADGSDIVIAYAKIVDKNGTVLKDAKNVISFFVQGDASIIGDGGNINANPMFPEYGVAPVLIRAGKTPGPISVSAKSKGLKSAMASMDLARFSANEILNKAQVIYDFNVERVDIGAADQLLQFGWNPWNGSETENNDYKFNNHKGALVKIRKKSSDGILRWLGEMNVIGKYGFAYGDGVIAMDNQGLDLIFENLSKGTYKLVTWHHAPSSNSDSMDPNREKLKRIKIPDLPYSDSIRVNSKAMIGVEFKEIVVTAGKEMQWASPGKSVITFYTDGSAPVIINFKPELNRGVWLNALELSEWK
ncbi:glycoside hydrolase family 2 protein [Croceitalea marina]|uniref:Glycoside hydrolase family 2 protein n=1 Tax=Croceitalea marina TaxID=1775166 RepID=A0ABW5MYE7_9FLAO